MKKQINSLYFSATDRTAKVVKAIVDGIGDDFKEYNITLPADRQNEFVFGANDLVVIGVPVYGGRVPKFLTDFFMNVKGNNTAAVFVTVYGNRNYDDALLELKNTLTKNGFIGVAGGAFIGEHSSTEKLAIGRPDADDIEIATMFGVEIKEKLEAVDDIFQVPKLIVKGNFPYKEGKISMPPMGPETNSECIDCGICAKYCPMAAINFDNVRDVDVNKCIRCCSCIKRCPKNAKAINHKEFKKTVSMLVDNFSKNRCEPELFI